ncbi:hypothetical protein [Motiliproteus sp. MSK22-1]|uniref:hypothetical protein n=1 Tax=Motiliproteus sp. MSK22-1 TaxID=1897630 RepID=UPI0009760689|nr:hypothetical protein [Motiliproteus sp. MSK22-1]OMH39758.1 hypothetical protein BGP75_01500 [Motiliproteus sp. MSK22-1]
MSEIIVMFKSGNGQNINSYAKHRLNFFIDTDMSENLEVFLNDNSSKSSPLHVASIEELSSDSCAAQFIDPHLNSNIISEINQSFPLLDSEYQIQLFTTYLTEEWEGLRSGTMVLRQTTNMATVDFVVSNSKDADAAPVETQNLAANDLPNLEGAASTLAKGLVKMLPPPADIIGATMLAAFWPSQSQSGAQWMQIYKALEEVLRSGLAEHDIKVASEKVDGFVLFLNTEYMVKKNSGRASKDELMELLSPYAKDFYTDIINILKFTEPDKVDVGISALLNFMTAACMQIALNQERALIDSKVRDPAKSDYAKIVETLIDDYIPYARNSARELKERRLAKIGEVQRKCDVIMDRSVCKSWFKDEADGTQETGANNAAIKKKREEHYNRIEKDLDVLLSKEVYGPIENWEKLKGNPVPQG